MYMKLIFSLHRAVELAVRRVALEQVREFHERVVDDHQLVLNGCQWRLTQAAVVVSWENLFYASTTLYWGPRWQFEASLYGYL